MIALGPKAQAIIKDYLKTDTQAFLFSPAEAMEKRLIEMRAKRKTRVQPSQMSRRKKKSKRPWGDRYSPEALNRAVRHACTNGDIPRWHVHQLRHLAADGLRREVGLEAAKAVLGHKDVILTDHYAAEDLARAVEAMAKLG